MHALPGIFNSQSNNWPLLVLAGSVESDVLYKGGFQELEQVSIVKPFTKFSAKITHVEQSARILSKAYRVSLFGKPGCSYVDIPGDIIQHELSNGEKQIVNKEQSSLTANLQAPRWGADPYSVQEAVRAIKTAKTPLVIVGKGAAYSGASEELTKFIDKFQIPFIPTPMGKGVISDFNKFNASSARSLALSSADVVILAGARLNWIMHFGEAKKYHPDVKFIQINLDAEQIGENYQNLEDVHFGLVGDVKLVVQQLLEHPNLQNYTNKASLLEILKEKIVKNRKLLADKEDTLGPSGKLTYNSVYKSIREQIKSISSNTVIVSEGANTMDIARISFSMDKPRLRLDAGTNSTMGVGLGYAIAAKLADPLKHVIAIEGDSAFGFSAMELETAARYNLGIVVVVMNNSGIYHGITEENKDDSVKKPIELSQDTRYDLLANALGAEGHLVTTLDELKNAIDASLAAASSGGKNGKKSSLINVIIEPGAQKKILFGWQNKKPKKEAEISKL